jgi:hypothetical protein
VGRSVVSLSIGELRAVAAVAAEIERRCRPLPKTPGVYSHRIARRGRRVWWRR